MLLHWLLEHIISILLPSSCQQLQLAYTILVRIATICRLVGALVILLGIYLVLLSLNAKSLNICDPWEITKQIVSFQLEPVVAIATFI